MEGASNQESAERISKEQVIESLRQNPENISLLDRYLIEQKKEIRDSRGELDLNIELAEIYRDAGSLDAAYEAFLDAGDQARQERDDALADKLFAEAEKLVIE